MGFGLVCSFRRGRVTSYALAVYERHADAGKRSDYLLIRVLASSHPQGSRRYVACLLAVMLLAAGPLHLGELLPPMIARAWLSLWLSALPLPDHWSFLLGDRALRVHRAHAGYGC
jgi:hypothetical protein